MHPDLLQSRLIKLEQKVHDLEIKLELGFLSIATIAVIGLCLFIGIGLL